jgi:hypothetical protein
VREMGEERQDTGAETKQGKAKNVEKDRRGETGKRRREMNDKERKKGRNVGEIETRNKGQKG